MKLICIFLFAVGISQVNAQNIQSKPIDRYSLVSRHNLAYKQVVPHLLMSVGNGEMAFNVDVTGLQTFPQAYENGIALTTMSNWGWHSFPNPENYTLKDVMRPIKIRGKIEMYPTIGFPYNLPGEKENAPSRWLNQNPHRFHLGQLGFVLLKKDGKEAAVADLKNINQVLDLWTGVIHSSFELEGDVVKVSTCMHPAKDQLAVTVQSKLIEKGRLKIKLQFPYGSSLGAAADWNAPEKHSTTTVQSTASKVVLERRLDSTRYFVSLGADNKFALQSANQHSFTIAPGDSDKFSFTCLFSPETIPASQPSAKQTQQAAIAYWKNFWKTGAVIDFTGSTNPRAKELERRIVLSQYYTASHSSGSLPPQESGLIKNTWSGKFHLEMHWYHSAQFALWNHPEMLEKNLKWYLDFLPKARELAKEHNYKGARWPKMVGPDGRESPNHINPFIIWQQPHIIYLAELLYRTDPTEKTLKKYRDLVLETAEFLVSYLFYDEAQKRYVLGPPIMPPPEIYEMKGSQYVTWEAEKTYNGSFELAYWDFGLRMAQTWRERLGMGRNKQWDNIIAKLSALPKGIEPDSGDSLYVHAENSPELWKEEKLRIHHPSMLMAKGFLPGTMVQDTVMSATLRGVMDKWVKNAMWGWDFPIMAMTAARLGKPEKAIESLFFDSFRNRYSAMGMNEQFKGVEVYLPSNGSLLAAVAMMAAGWDGNTVELPGFPKDGTWNVRYEGLKKFP